MENLLLFSMILSVNVYFNGKFSFIFRELSLELLLRLMTNMKRIHKTCKNGYSKLTICRHRGSATLDDRGFRYMELTEYDARDRQKRYRWSK